MDSFPARVEAVIREHALLADGGAVLVAASGGCDSMVLLCLLADLAPGHGWRLAVAHFNHGLRGRASDADEALVRETAERLRLPFRSGRGDVRAQARTGGVSVEMAARVLRHEFLAREAVACGVAVVALGHHADDQTETFFLRVLRGSGGEGLGGMGFVDPSPADRRVRLVRPLLAETREAIRGWARERGVIFREDASNRRDDVPRNLLRRRVLPVLQRTIQPALSRTVARVMRVLGDDADFAAASARLWLGGGEAAGFDVLHPAVQRQVILIQLRELRVEAGFELVERLRREPRTPVITPRGLPVWRDAVGRLHAGRVRRGEFETARLEIPLTGRAGEGVFGGLQVRWRIRVRKPGSVARLAGAGGREVLDAGAVGDRVTLRHWQRGDRFRPLGMTGTAKLQDLFVNARVPREQRHVRVVAVSGEGEIFWVEGLRPAEQARVRPATRRVLEWRWARDEPPGVMVAARKRAC